MAALDHHDGFLRTRPAIVAGDFNNSTVWDRKGRPGNFSTIATRFEDMGLASAYHKLSQAEFGAEAEQTHFWRKGPSEFHIDYCFLPRSWPATSAKVGSRENWIAVSDHAPLVVDCDSAP
jgi:endonuclease/exonuclease/phosphatase family metal-dependent hydrolase